MTTAPQRSSPAAPSGADRGTFPVVPAGTTLVTVARVLADSHQRGGRREHVARVTSAELRDRLRAEGPGRYRVSCLDGRGCFLRGGAFVLEVLPGSLEAVAVPARKPGDYPRRRPSAAALARRGTQRIEQRVQGLQAELREANVARARLGREAAGLRETHGKELLHLHGYVETLHEKLERVMDRVKQLEAGLDSRHRAGSEGLARVRQALAAERRERAEDVARLAARVASAAAAPIPLVVGPPQSEPLPPLAAPGIPDGVTWTIEGPPTRPSTDPSPRPEAPRVPGLAALANVRAVVHPRVSPRDGSSAPPGVRSPDYVEGLGDFFRLRPPRPK